MSALRQTILFGSGGLLGQGIARQLAQQMDARTQVRTISWTELTKTPLRELLGVESIREGAFDFIFANGLTDPGLPPESLAEANLEFPKRVYQETSFGKHHRYLTFGSIQERVGIIARANPYFQTKLHLSDWVGEKVQREGLGRFLHLRLHTLYGARAPKPHMFLGQMVQALKDGKEFQMSSGDQLREYHHVDDIAQVVGIVLARQWDTGPVIELTHGNPVRLDDLARAVFSALGKENLLKIGGIERAKYEMMESLPTAPGWILPYLKKRDMVSGVVQYVRDSVENRVS